MSETRTWSEEVRFRLVTWGLWASGAQLYRNPSSIIAAMIERAAGELPGDDLSVPLDMTFEIHVVEKALARMKLSSFGSSRELSLAKTKIEEAVMWAVKHITR